MKEQIKEAISGLQQDLLELSHNIHDNPELGFSEHKAVKWQTDLLQKHGFHIETPYAGLGTSYKASFRLGKGGQPCIAFLAEYDALSGMGHGCGHNLIAAIAVGAALGITKANPPIDGEILVLGCPAEETGNGKVVMINNGGFSGIDFAMMIHPGVGNTLGRKGLAQAALDIEFRGKSAHSKEPSEGINALTSLINVFMGIDVLRQTWADGVRINGIITSGGNAPNIIPDFAAGRFAVRAKTVAYLKKMLDDIQRVVQGCAALTGAVSTVKVGLISTERYCNAVMGQALKHNLALVGEEMEMATPTMAIGSSDFGNVSMIIPGIHEYMSIVSPGIRNHTPEFTVASASPRSDEVVIKGAQGLAMTAYDILANESLRKEIYDEFYATVPQTQKNE